MFEYLVLVRENIKVGNYEFDIEYTGANDLLT